MNIKKVFQRINQLSPMEKRWLLQGVDELLFQEITDGEAEGEHCDLLKECIRMYIRQDCRNGEMDFTYWLHKLYESGESKLRFMVDEAARRMTPGYFREYSSIIYLMRMKPGNIQLDIEKLWDDMVHMDERYWEWVRRIAVGNEKEEQE